jgi:hypothetical protein
MTIHEARERVARGAALLDEKRPGWSGRINTGPLELACPTLCILGQLYGHFNLGRDTLFPGEDYRATCDDDLGPYLYGFDLTWQEYDKFGQAAAFKPLQDAWIEAIADRVVPKPVASNAQPVTGGAQ